MKMGQGMGDRMGNEKGEDGGLRSLIVFTSRPHDNIRRRRLRSKCPLPRLAARSSLLEESLNGVCDTAHVPTRIRRNNTQQPLAGFLEQVGLLEHTLGAVDVRQVERGPRVAGVENGGEAHAGEEGFNHDEVHFVIDNVAGGAEVDGVDYFVVAVIFVAIEVRGLAAVTCRGVSH